MRTDEIISIAEAIRTLGVQRNAIYNAINTGKLQTVDISGKRFLLRASVDAYKPRADAGKERAKKDTSDA